MFSFPTTVISYSTSACYLYIMLSPSVKCKSLIFFFFTTTGYAQLARNLADVPCGQQWRIGRIIGGQNANPGEFPWLVSIRQSGGHFCGGSIVNKRWVVTAGHCMCSGPTEIRPNQLQVAVGEHNLKAVISPTLLRVRKIHLHPQYKCPTFVNDIALLELDGYIDWSANVGPACLPIPTGYSGSSSYGDREATTAGWGWMDESYSIGNRADVLQKVKVTVVENDKCRDWYRSQGKKVKILDSQMCAGDEKGGKDSCWADSGGPLMIRNSDGMTVVGIVSTGIGCGRPRLPGLYTRLSEFMPWVLNMING